MWTFTMSLDGEPQQLWADVAIEDDRDVYRCALSLLADLQDRHEDPKVYINEKLFRPREVHTLDYVEYVQQMLAGDKPKKPSLPESCMRPYATDKDEHAKELREQVERVVEEAQRRTEPLPRPRSRVKVKVR